MKKILMMLVLLIALTLSACTAYDPISEQTEYALSEQPRFEATYHYLTFEEALSEFATDVVIVQYVDHRPFGDNLLEFEFIVLERVLGYAADRIFVYVDPTIEADVFGSDMAVVYRPGDLTFTHGTTYMLALIGIDSPYANTRENGFTFIRNIVINLDDTASSMMYSEPLALHSESLDFDGSDVVQEIISYAIELTYDNPPAMEVIRSQAVEDITNESPYVLVVEINEPLRLSNEQESTDWMATDIYFVTVVEALKGDINVGYEFVMIFNADTVLPGERHIIAIEELEEGIGWYRLTSRNSLFQMSQFDEITSVLSQ